MSLAPDAAAPVFEYTYQFSFPGDCLRVLSVGEVGDAMDYTIEGRKVLLDETELRLRYIYRNEDVTSWDSLLVEAMEAYMAMTCAYPITKSASMVEAMTKLWQFKLQQARTVDGQENPPEQAGDFPFLNARRG